MIKQKKNLGHRINVKFVLKQPKSCLCLWFTKQRRLLNRSRFRVLNKKFDELSFSRKNQLISCCRSRMWCGSVYFKFVKDWRFNKRKQKRHLLQSVLKQQPVKLKYTKVPYSLTKKKYLRGNKLRNCFRGITVSDDIPSSPELSTIPLLGNYMRFSKLTSLVCGGSEFATDAGWKRLKYYQTIRFESFKLNLISHYKNLNSWWFNVFKKTTRVVKNFNNWSSFYFKKRWLFPTH